MPVTCRSSSLKLTGDSPIAAFANWDAVHDSAGAAARTWPCSSSSPWRRISVTRHQSAAFCRPSGDSGPRDDVEPTFRTATSGPSWYSALRMGLMLGIAKDFFGTRTKSSGVARRPCRHDRIERGAGDMASQACSKPGTCLCPNRNAIARGLASFPPRNDSR